VVIGFVVAHVIGEEWEIENLVVAPHSRNQGIGGALVTAVIQVARARSATRLMLEVRESNTAARSLYRKLGFNESGRREDYYSTPAEAAILLALDLH
jgi:[ribosomal protein S18]-alanine N-acetyltransferase